MLGEEAAREEAIREATYSGRPLGSDGFITSLERRLSRKLVRGKPGRPKTSSIAAAGATI